MTLRPRIRLGAAGNQIAIVRRVILHHLHQLFAELGIAVHDEHLHHCVGAVNGGGKRFKSRLGSARTACN